MQIAPDQIDPDAAKVVQRLRSNDHAAYLVGGCVRDLLLGRKPKDFDVATSATPQEIKRLFRNCRIIGRRFRLAHIFFGPKIIETSTFRANPRELEDDEADAGAEVESGDLLIRRDNVFGSEEEDARRRDFTINGLFYDIQTAKVIDHVGGMVDLEARLVRTIGDPDIRFREDPIRILRAVKFAARCELSIEPETYRRMMEHRGEIGKAAQARVSEEFYRLLRGGAARPSVELLLKTDLLGMLAPELAKALAGEPEDAEAATRRARFWAYLGALDRSTARRPLVPSNALVLATILLPPLRDALDPDSTGVRDVGALVGTSIQPFLERVRASRRDGELSRQILLALRYLLPSKHSKRKRPRLAGREFFDEAVALCEIITEAETAEPTLAGQPIVGAGDPPPEGYLDEETAPELESLDDGRRGRRRRGGRRGGPGASGPERRPADERAPEALTYAGPLGAGPSPLPELPLPTGALDRPPFLGLGSFGGRWNVGGD